MSIIERAEDELRRVNFGEDDTKVMLRILRMFFDQWDSGGAVAAVAPLLPRLIAGKPLSPLTGAADEWMDTSEYGDPDMAAQNVRCSLVFKRLDGSAYFLDTQRGVRVPIDFPYWPEGSEVEPPEMVVATDG